MSKKLFSVISALLTIAFVVNAEDTFQGGISNGSAVVMPLSSVSDGALFIDDFSDEAEANLKWLLLNPNEFEVNFGNDVVELKNTSETASNGIYRSVGTEISTFTFSSDMTFVGDGQWAGISFCMSSDLNSIYIFLIKSNGDYTCGKLGDNNAVKHSSYITSTKNTLKVSKDGTNANVFVNGKFITKVTASESSGAFVGLFVNPKTTVTFDNALLTDKYETGANPSVFEDDFEKNTLAGWSGKMHLGNGTAEVKGGKLHVNTMAVEDKYASSIRTDVTVKDDFVMRVELSHKSGETLNTYGLSLWGEDENDRANFCIVADRSYGSSIGYVSFELHKSSSIKGKAFVSSSLDTTYYVDTLEVVKKKGINKFFFVINKDTVTAVEGVNFEITQVGIESSSKIVIEADNFSIKPLESSISLKRPNSNRPKISKKSNTMVFDIMGRSAGRMVNFSNVQINRATGVYVNKDYKGKIVLKK